MRRAAVPMLICASLALAGCGEAGAGGDEPAALVPVGAELYAEAVVRPEGGQRDDALAAAGKLLRTDDPSGKVRDLVNRAFAESGDGITWERDFAPWLGEKVGVWASGFDRPQPSYAVIADTTDADKAKEALARLDKLDGGTSTKRSHAGTDYTVDQEGAAFGVVEDHVVIGTEAAFKRTVDERDGDHLEDAQRYKDALEGLADDRLGHYYVDAKPLFDAALRRDPTAAQQLEQFKAFFPIDELGPITGAFTADGDGMAVETVMSKVPDGPLKQLAQLSTGSDATVLGELPGDAWGALAMPKVGESAKQLFSTFAGAIGGAAVTAQIQQQTGLNLEQDVFSWMGDLGLFVRGTSLSSSDGGVVIEVTDEAKATAAFGKLIGLIGRQTGAAAQPIRVPGAEQAFVLASVGSPQRFVLARGNGRVVATVGEKAAADALDPSAKLSDSDGYDQARAALGDGLTPAFMLSMPAVVQLVDSSGSADADFQQARPYLESLGMIAAGGKVDGDRVESRLAVAFK